MKPFYWQGTKNFGDYLNAWLWKRLVPECIDEDENTRLIGIGSLLKDTLSRLPGNKLVFGTGSGYGAVPHKSLFSDWKFYFVRGPVTAKAFELQDDKAIVDGAWLLSLLPEYSKLPTQKKGVAFIPHWTTADSESWAGVCNQADISYVDPQGDLVAIIDKIAGSELVITESLHGAILADLFRTPWIPVQISSKFLPIKWIDWFASVDLTPQMRRLPHSDWFDYVINKESCGNLSYSACPFALTAPPFVEGRETVSGAGGVRSAGFLYRRKIAVKKSLRKWRRGAMKVMQPLRKCLRYEWNTKHRQKLADSLMSLSAQTPSLSSDTLRGEKISRLEEAKYRLTKQHAAGFYVG